jgi:hypothetical protein
MTDVILFSLSQLKAIYATGLLEERRIFESEMRME